jgi:hypothetical protein
MATKTKAPLLTDEERERLRRMAREHIEAELAKRKLAPDHAKTDLVDWPLLSEAISRLDARAIAAAYDVIGRGQVPVTAVRDDTPGTTPEPVKALLAKATRALVDFSKNEITAYFDSRQDRAIFGPRSDLNMRQPWSELGELYPTRRDLLGELKIGLYGVRVPWPALVEALAAAGAVDAPNAPEASLGALPQRRGAYKGELSAFMGRLNPKLLARLNDDDIAQRFVDYVNAQIKAGRSALKLPQVRNIANQVATIRARLSKNVVPNGD